MKKLELLFCDQGQLYKERHVRRVFHRILFRANLPNFRVYDLRHSCVRYSRRENLAPKAGTRDEKRSEAIDFRPSS